MPKYLAHVSYTGEGLKGLLKDGGTKRREVVVQLAKSLEGALNLAHPTTLMEALRFNCTCFPRLSFSLKAL